MATVDLPYIIEYAKSGRSSCKACRKPISKEEIRMGIMVQSPKFDGKIPLWHHLLCFLNKKKALKTVSDIANFDNLRWDDQKMIKDHIGFSSSTTSNSAPTNDKNKEFSIAYAKSNRSSCKVCNMNITKGEVRISKMIYDSEEALRLGPLPGWHHVDCFVEIKQDLEFVDSGDKLPGFETLSSEDQKMIKKKIKAQKGVKRKKSDAPVTPPKVQKTESKDDLALQEQNKLMFDMRDKLKEHLDKKEMIKLLKSNSQHISVGESRLLDHLTDCLIFGAIKACPECKTGRPRFKIDRYHCPGYLTEWTKCEFTTKVPCREPFIVPEDFKDNYEFLKEYKYVKRDRLFAETNDVSSPQKKNKLPLSDFKIAMIGRTKKPKNSLTETILQLGGEVTTAISKTVTCVISSESEFKKCGAKIKKAESLDIHVISENFVEAVKNGSTPAVAMVENMLSTWGGDPILKFGIKKEESEKSKSKASTSNDNSKYTKSVPKIAKITVQGGAAVDPDSELEGQAHVFEQGGCIYNVVLGKVDISKGTNSYYKLQILESNTRKRFWVFRSWGRVGTTIGGTKLDGLESVDSAIDLFEELYLEKTGNVWENRKNFVKQPGLLYPLDIDYGQDNKELQNQKNLKPGSNSKLPKAVQELICFIFDIEAMKKAMVEFEIDLNKMPLGKLSKNQIEKAYSVLTELQQILQSGGNATKILDASNRFYTLIPHDFGMKKIPLLDNEELIKSKIEMVDSLLEIEFAYNLLKSDGSSTKDPVDEHYEKLKTDIEVLDKNTTEYKNIETYLKNTHAATHSSYSLKIEEVFKINRHGERERYTSKYKNLHNKKLLWHGSRFTNFVGILTNGLRIAPPEAPATGYMFGKGVYFADMVSKSANYCFTTRQNRTGLLLLCEVALGNMYEKTNSEFIQKLPKNKHSTWGMGQTVPDPKVVVRDNDVEIPLGKPVMANKNTLNQNLSLLYNEYIVYDVNQVNIKYLLKVDFKHKY